ncbi:MAG: hypothetical protein ACK2UK_19730 [Candidatus Promineifilaceae bacterium]
MQQARYVRLYADDLGETHFEDVEVALAAEEFVRGAPPIFVADSFPAAGSLWLGVPGDWQGEVPHPTPRRLILCTVQGEYQITAGDGEVRCFPAGSVLLIEDTRGQGHQTNIPAEKGALIFAVALPEEDDASLVV